VLLACDKLGYGDERLHGVGRLVVDWTRGLRRAGVDVTTVVLRKPGALAKRLSAEGLPVVYLGRSSFDPLTLGDLARLIRERGLQVAHLQNYGSTALGRVAAGWCGIPAIVHVHANLVERPYDYPLWLRAADRVLRPWTAACLAVSESAARSAVLVQGFPEHDVRVLRNPIDLDRFHPDAAARESVRRELGLEPDEVAVLCVARLFRVKGVDQLLDAWHVVEGRASRGRLLVAGDGPERAALEGQVERLGLRRVRFLGHRQDVEDVLRASDFLVVSSRSETGPLSAVEAMATALPVVAFRVGGVAEHVQDGEHGLLVPAGDVAALAERILRLVEDEPLRLRLGSAARERSEEFGLDRFIARLVGEYRRVVERSAAQALK
jgi:glycosyltransferase involved in cell wall biosynthesis